MILGQGEKIHVIVRRGFDNDLRRHFLGVVAEASGVLARVEGHVFVLDTGINQYVRRSDKRIRIIGLADPGNIINVLPPNADLEHAKYIQSEERRLILTDGKTFSLDINEFGITQ
jgi:hypothetical protein